MVDDLLGQVNASLVSLARISENVKTVKSNIKTAIAEVLYVCIATDCRSAHRRSFTGVTAHRTGDVTLERRSAAFACKRLKGRHTYDVLAEKLEDIHSEYNIQAKMGMTTTDSGSIFLRHSMCLVIQ